MNEVLPLLDFGQIKIFTIGLFVFLSLALGHFLSKRIFGREQYLKYEFPQVIIISLFFSLIVEAIRVYLLYMNNFTDIGILFDNVSLTFILVINFAIFYYIEYLYSFVKEDFSIRESMHIFFFFVISASWLLMIGLFFDGHGYGIPTNLPWGVTYNSIFSTVPYTVPIHPTQLYMAFFFFLGWVVSTIYPKDSINVFFMLVAPVYFFIDFLKGDTQALFLGLSWTQYITIIAIFCYFYFVVFKIPESMKTKTTDEEDLLHSN